MALQSAEDIAKHSNVYRPNIIIGSDARHKNREVYTGESERQESDKLEPMGSKVEHEKPPSFLKKKSTSSFSSSVRLASSASRYRPRTQQSSEAYGKLKAYMDRIYGIWMGDQLDDAAETVLTIMKSEHLKEKEKKSNLESELSWKISGDQFAQLSQCSRSITDFIPDDFYGSSNSGPDIKTNDSALDWGVTAAIDEDEDNGHEGIALVSEVVDNINDRRNARNKRTRQERDLERGDRNRDRGSDEYGGGGGGRKKGDGKRGGERGEGEGGKDDDDDEDGAASGGEEDDDDDDEEDNADGTTKDNTEGTTTKRHHRHGRMRLDGSLSSARDSGAAAAATLLYVEPSSVDAAWVQRRISDWIPDHTASLQVANQVLDIIGSPDDDRVVENALVALFNMEHFDFVRLLLHNRATIYYCSRLKQAQTDEERAEIEGVMEADTGTGTGSVASSSSLEEKRRKQSAPLTGREVLMILHSERDDGTADGSSGSSSSSGQRGGSGAAQSGKDEKQQKGVLGLADELANQSKQLQVLDLNALAFDAGSHHMTDRRFDVPKGAHRVQGKGYDEVVIPAPERPAAFESVYSAGSSFSAASPLISIASLPKWAHVAFKDTQRLNIVQSVVYDFAFKSDKNMLVCAPTGAGKTNVAMLCVLNTMFRHSVEGEREMRRREREKERQLQRAKKDGGGEKKEEDEDGGVGGGAAAGDSGGGGMMKEEEVLDGEGKTQARVKKENEAAEAGEDDAETQRKNNEAVYNISTLHLLLNKFKIIYIAPMKSLVQEMVATFSRRLSPYGISVRELSGDSQLNRQQLADTQVVVTTPEKYDIVTRKSGDRSVQERVRLVIIDEVHLLHDTRGAVLEAIVARIKRGERENGERVRIIGLSATLPNYEDIAQFLQVARRKVKPGTVVGKSQVVHPYYRGLFHFPNNYRPVPLEQTFIGIKEKKGTKKDALMSTLVYEKVVEHITKQDKQTLQQILVFVHSRRDTARTARFIVDKAMETGILSKFTMDEASHNILTDAAESDVIDSDLRTLLPNGVGIHHAGLCKSDRSNVESLFREKHIAVLVSTATLAWGVNLPAHTVIIKGTQVYSPEKSAWVEISPMDVMQMLGRAGRPQYDDTGVGIVITSAEEMLFYLSLMNERLKIESQMIPKLAECLNAEVCLGNISSVADAVSWMRETYLYVRMRKAPEVYGVPVDELEREDADRTARRAAHIQGTAAEEDEELDPNNEDTDGTHLPLLRKRREDLCHTALVYLSKAGLVVYNQRVGAVFTTELGRISSHFYITPESMKVYSDNLRPSLDDAGLFRVFAMSTEFKTMSVREEEKDEIAAFIQKVPVPIKEAADNPIAKTIILLQCHIASLPLAGSTLLADTVYVTQSASRLIRALFELALRKKWAQLALRSLTLCKAATRRMWASQCPLRQFPDVEPQIIRALESRDVDFSIISSSTAAQFGEILRSAALGRKAERLCRCVPAVECDVVYVPITATFLRLDMEIRANFQWDQNVHGASELFWVFVEDCDGETLLHYECVSLSALHTPADRGGGDLHRTLSCFVPITAPPPPQYFVRLVSDRWICPESCIVVSFQNLILPAFSSGSSAAHQYTELLDLQLQHVSALRNDMFQRLYSGVLDALWNVDRRKRAANLALLAKRGGGEGGDKDEGSSNSAVVLLGGKEQQQRNDEFGWGLKAAHLGCASSSFSFFNPIQTQLFKSLYEKNNNVLIAAPPGSGRRVCAELAVLHALTVSSSSGGADDEDGEQAQRVVFVSPHQSTCEYVYDAWRLRFGSGLGCVVSLLAGVDSPSNGHLFANSHIIVTSVSTLETLSRKWKAAPGGAAKKGSKAAKAAAEANNMPPVALFIFDNLHLVNTLQYGPLYEACVYRVRQYYSGSRLMGLSSGVADAQSLGSWINVNAKNCFSFSFLSRPVRLTPVIIGFENSTGGAESTVNRKNDRDREEDGTSIMTYEGNGEEKERTLAMSRPVFTLLNTYATPHDNPAIVFVPGTWQGRQLCLDVLNMADAHQHTYAFLGRGDGDRKHTRLLRNMMKGVGIKARVEGDDDEGEDGKEGEEEDDDVVDTRIIPRLFRLLQSLLSSTECYRLLACSPLASDRIHAPPLPESAPLYSSSTSSLSSQTHFKYPSFSSTSSTASSFPPISPFLRNVAASGVALLNDGLHPTTQLLLRFLFRCGFLRLLVVPHALCWSLTAERAALVVITSPTVFDANERRFVDMDTADILQIMSFTGRDDVDRQTHFAILCQQSKMEYYNRLISEPLPVESRLDELSFLDILNAEVAGRKIRIVRDTPSLLTWTYLYRRLALNPNFYKIIDRSELSISAYLSEMADNCLTSLAEMQCAERTHTGEAEKDSSKEGEGGEDGDKEKAAKAKEKEQELSEDDVVTPTLLGRIASLYSVSVTSLHTFAQHSLKALLVWLSAAVEFDGIEVRQGEAYLLAQIAKHAKITLPSTTPGAGAGAAGGNGGDGGFEDGIRKYENPNNKVFFLLQGYFSRHFNFSNTPSVSAASKYYTPAMFQDVIQILPVALRLTHAAVHALAIHSSFKLCYIAMAISQMIVQGMWADQKESQLLQLPHVDASRIEKIQRHNNRIRSVDNFIALDPDVKMALLGGLTVEEQVDVVNTCNAYPNIRLAYRMAGESTEYKEHSGEDEADEEEVEEVFEEGEEVVMTVFLDRVADEDEEDEEGGGGKEKNDDDEDDDVLLKDPNQKGGGNGGVAALSATTPPIVPSIHYPQMKEEGWWLLIVNKEEEPVLGFQKVAVPQRRKKSGKKPNRPKVTLRFVVPELATVDKKKEKGKGEVEWQLLLISDCWIGADLSLLFRFNVRKKEEKE